MIFVFLWSTGYVGARYGLPDSPPFTLLAIRMALAGGLLALAARLSGTAFPRGEPLRRSAVTGLLQHGGYLGGVFLGISRGVPAGLSAVIVNIQPSGDPRGVHDHRAASLGGNQSREGINP